MPEHLNDILGAFGLTQRGRPMRLTGGKSDALNIRVDTEQGTVVVKSVQPEHETHEAERSRLQETARNHGAPVPRCLQTPEGDFVDRSATVQAFVDGESREPPEHGGSEFGRALGSLDRALARQPIRTIFASQTDVYTRGRSPEYVREHYLPVRDDRFPAGYDEELRTTLEAIESQLQGTDASEKVLAHVDPNPENAIFADGDRVTLIDITPGVKLPGYSLGAAIYWWAYPWQSNHLRPEMARAIASGYRSVLPLDERHWSLIATHVLTHGMMAMAIPLGIIADGGLYDSTRLPGVLERQQKLRSHVLLIQDAISTAGG